MAGHPLLNQVKAKTDIVAVAGKLYNVHLSYHRVDGVDGFVVGLKFSDEGGSMDSAKPGNVNPYALGRAVANKAAQMLNPDLDSVSILAFYLLTEDIDTPLCQDSCRPDRTENEGGENMRDRNGPIRTGIQEQGSGAAVAAGERLGG